MLVSSPAARLRDSTLQGDDYSASGKSCSRGSNLVCSICAVIALAVLLLPGAAGVYGQANVEGQWQTVPTTMPINPVHVSLMHNGQILVVSGSGNYPPDTNYQAAIWNPSNNTVTTQTIGWDMFCSGMIALPDGREMIFGGTLQYDPFHGWQRTSIYDPATGQFADMQDMAHGRWYPTPTELSDGRLLVFSGLDENGIRIRKSRYIRLPRAGALPTPPPGFLLCIPECIFFRTATFSIQDGLRNHSISFPPPTLGRELLLRRITAATGPMARLYFSR